jgi:spermidine/putrescine-binding protein
LTKLYWRNEYHDLQPAFRAGRVWVAYGFQDSYVNMRNAGLKVEFMEPRQGKLVWVRGFMLGAKTKSYRHAHRYVESFINHAATVQMVNLLYYGSADATIKSSEVKDKALAKALDVGNLHALTAKDVHIQSWEPNQDQIALAWQDVHRL